VCILAILRQFYMSLVMPRANMLSCISLGVTCHSFPTEKCEEMDRQEVCAGMSTLSGQSTCPIRGIWPS
jgi:hypothetical protein